MNTVIIGNPVIWCIAALAFVTYFLLIRCLLADHLQPQQQRDNKAGISSTLITALPLLGLLGTISGLLKTFAQLAMGSLDQSALLSSGIADALLTTQLGLVTAIPAWLMLAAIRKSTEENGMF